MHVALLVVGVRDAPAGRAPRPSGVLNTQSRGELRSGGLEQLLELALEAPISDFAYLER